MCGAIQHVHATNGRKLESTTHSARSCESRHGLTQSGSVGRGARGAGRPGTVRPLDAVGDGVHRACAVGVHVARGALTARVEPAWWSAQEIVNHFGASALQLVLVVVWRKDMWPNLYTVYKNRVDAAVIHFLSK